MNRTMIIVIIAVVLVAIAGGAFFFMRGKQQKSATTGNYQEFTNPELSVNDGSGNKPTGESASMTVSWQYNGSQWQSSGTPPACPEPTTLQSPTDLNKATAILYPGQIRGGNYKPHGGFIFKGQNNDAISVTAPFDANVIRGSRYIEQGEVQYLFDIIAPCGVMYRFDHLRTLSETFQKLADTLPAAKADDTQTHNFTSPALVKSGDVIATSVGFLKNNNASFDWGVYDLRTKNEASKNATWSSQHSGEQASNAVCWFDWLSADNEAKVRSLPAGDAQNGKTSDYCK